MTPVAPYIAAYLREHLAVERGASPQTCETYAYALQLLLTFAAQQLRTSPSQLTLEQLDAPLVLSFLAHLQQERGNSACSRNSRLAAVRSFMRFLEYRVPAVLDQIRAILAIPAQRTDQRIVPHLAEAEYRAVLDTPDPQTRLGIRDRAMLHIAIAGGLRVSELVGLRGDDVTFDGRYVHLHIRGKGRRERVLSLWSAVARSLRAWLAVRGTASAPEVFLNAWSAPLTRSGFARILAKHRTIAAKQCPSLHEKRVSPHVLRHTCAFNTLKATADIRKVALWLGHSSIETADRFYLRSDPTQHLEILKRAAPPSLRPGKFRAPDKLIALLRGKHYAAKPPPGCRGRRAPDP
jgi:site-specific recombinase XerD